MKAPLVVRSVIDGRRYLMAVVFMVFGITFIVLGASGTLGLPPLVWFASIFLALWGPASAANTFLGYPRLTVSGNLLVLESSYFTAKKVDLGGLGAAYVIQYPKNRGLATELIFRTAEDEAS